MQIYMIRSLIRGEIIMIFNIKLFLLCPPPELFYTYIILGRILERISLYFIFSMQSSLLKQLIMG